MDWLERAGAAGVKGFLHPLECQQLHEFARSRDVLEIGAFCGLSAWIMSHSAKSVLSVDTFKANTGGQEQMEELTTLEAFLAATKDRPNVSHFVGTSAEAAWEFRRRRFDMIFLDANHQYDSVKQDLELWVKRIKPGGILAAHDYGHSAFPGVKQAMDERFGDLGEYDPPNQPWVVTLRWVQL